MWRLVTRKIDTSDPWDNLKERSELVAMESHVPEKREY
jgi:hypothetical protein